MLVEGLPSPRPRKEPDVDGEDISRENRRRQGTREGVRRMRVREGEHRRAGTLYL